MEMESCRVSLFALIQLFLYLSAWLRVSTAHSLLLPRSTPLCGYTTMCLNTPLMGDIWLVPSVWLEQIKMQWMLAEKPLYGRTLVRKKYECKGWVVRYVYLLKKLPICFPKSYHLNPHQRVWAFQSLYIFSNNRHDKSF